MAEYTDREHFIPLRKSDLIAALRKDLTGEDRGCFDQFCLLVESTFHFEYHKGLGELKDAYAPFDPDADTRPLFPPKPEQRQQQLAKLFEKFVWLMERANFKRLSRQDIEQAMSAGASDWGINMAIDFDVFERLEVFARGDVMGKRSRRRLFNLWRLEEVTLPVYQRLVLVMKLRQHRRLGPDINTEAVYLKIFKDIPKLDLEMLFPGARVQMPKWDQGKLWGSLVGTVGWVGYKIYADLALLASALAGNPFAFWGPLSLVAGYGYKQYYGYQQTKQSYSLMLTQSLYYQNLDNNGGVITRLLDEAEDQECREAILGYYFLWRKAAAGGWTSAQLDDYIEMELENRANVKVDFEVSDALAKLERLGLVDKTADRYRARPIAAVLETLQGAWNNSFKPTTPAEMLAST